MGAKTWMLVTSNGDAFAHLAAKPALRHDDTIFLVKSMFPADHLVQEGVGDLYYTSPPDENIFAGDFGEVKVLAAREFAIDYPSTLPKLFIPTTGLTTLHAMHSVVDWFAFAHWVDGQLVRSLSLSPDSGILEDKGERMAFEAPFWLGEKPAVDDDEEANAFPFHPLELGEEALLNFFGYQIEGLLENNQFDPEEIKLLNFARRGSLVKKAWWQFWK